jgi:hypothetical protein
MSSSDSVVDPLLFFFEVCIHALLFSRGLYPKGLFQRQSAYGCIVWMCVSPLVCDGIRHCLGDARPLFLANAVEALVVPLLCPNTGAVLMRYIFEVNFQSAEDPVTSADIDTQLAAVLKALQALEYSTAPVSLGTTWTIQLRTHHVGEAPAASSSSATFGDPIITGFDQNNWSHVNPPETEAQGSGFSGVSGGSGGGGSSAPGGTLKCLGTVGIHRLAVRICSEL